MIDNVNMLDSVKFNSIKSKEKAVSERIENRADIKDILKQQLKPSGKKVKDEKLMDVCLEMESIFVAKMLKEMRNTVHKSEWIHGGFAEEVFEPFICLLRRAKSSEHAHGPESTTVHGGMDSAGERVFARKPQLGDVIEIWKIHRRIQPLNRRAGGCDKL